MSVSDEGDTNGSEISEVTELYENKTHLINELLFYVSNYTKGGSCTPENIKGIVLSFYDEDMIWKAKQLLWNKVKDGILKKFERRNDTKIRTAKDANALDIVQAFQDMDKKSYNDVVFLAADINKIPREHPEKLHELSILDRLSVLENKSKIVENSSSRNYAGMVEIIDDIKKINGNIATNEKLIQDVAQQLEQEIQKEKSNMLDSSKSVHKEVSVIEKKSDSSTTTKKKVRSFSTPETGHKVEQDKNKVQVVGMKIPTDTGGNTFIQEKINAQIVGTDVRTGGHGFTQRKSSFSNIPGNKMYSKFPGNSRLRPQALMQEKNQRNSISDNKRHGSQRYISNNKKRDEVFFDNRLPRNNRKDSSGYQFTRDQVKRMQYKNKVTESHYIRIFVYNVPHKYNVDDVYDHFSNLDINVVDLWQSSHPDARRKSFGVKMPSDEIMENLNIRVREYNERSD